MADCISIDEGGKKLSAKQETNMEKLNRHRADLARCYASRDKRNERISRLE